MLHLQSFPNSQKNWEIGIVEVTWFHILLDCEDNLSDTVCLRKERETQFMIKLVVFKKKKCSYFYTTISYQFNLSI